MTAKTFRILILGLALLGLVSLSLFAGGEGEGDKGQIVLYADMVRGHTNPVGPLCALSSQYHQGEMVVWRMRLFDTGAATAIPRAVETLLEEKPDKDTVAAMAKGINVTVHLSDGQSFPARFGNHGGKQPDGGDYFWSASWEIPVEYPTGAMEYWVTVEWAEKKKSARHDPFNVGLSKLTITPYVVPPKPAA